MAEATSTEIARTQTPPAAAQAQEKVPALSSAAVAAASEAISAETKRAYASRLRRLETQLAGRAADDHGLSEALSELAETGLSPAWLAQAAAATRFAARLAGRPDPVGASCELVLKAHRRQVAPPRQVAALDWSQADAAAAAANGGGGLAGLRDGAIISVMSDALLRVSEVAALDTTDITRDADGSAAVTVRRSKTDQEGEGAVLYLGAPTVRRLGKWQEAAGITDGPLFRPVNKSGQLGSERITARSVRRIVTARANDIGIEGASGHSLRVGSAQSLVRAGAELPEAMLAGRWQSPAMVSRYARSELAARGAIARLRHGR